MPDLQYSNWTDNKYGTQMTPAQVQRLARQLKTYVNSTKFIRQGQSQSVTDPVTGFRVKLPLNNVKYYDDQNNALSAQQLQSQIRSAVLHKDPVALQRASKYNYMSYDVGQDPKKLIAQQLKRKKDLRRMIMGLSTVGGTLGMASIPIIDAVRKGYYISGKDVAMSGLLAPVGMGTGLALGYLITKAVL